MGGYRINGCGVTDHLKSIKSLGMYHCPNCKKLTEFTLDEANQKIDVFWIPTLTLKSRYAVVCKKCKNGEFCSAEWAGYLLNQTTGQELIFESKAKAKGWSAATRSFQETTPQQSMTKQPEQPLQPVSQKVSEVTAKDVPLPVTAGGSVVPRFFKCAYCGVTQMREGNFCAYCGKPAPESEQSKPFAEQPAEKDCPYCGAKVKPGMLFCAECGTKI
ncbi:MAG: zinc ribbon domain-containing protein [Blautia sp.]|nr:zinc ribbon domain-containing protein [Lachnoclostridium sp.]MCM1212095.1 zinc ribbon domain-containing protein [Blautia sp.]